MGESYNKWMYRIRKAVFNKHIKRLNLDWSSINALDIGTGTGFYIDRWKELGIKDITGCDITEVAVKNLLKNYKDHNFYLQDISEELHQEIADKKYSIISAFDVLFHIVDDEKYKKAISNIYDLLDENGYFILSDNFVHKETQRSSHHVNRTINYTYNTLQDIGFEVQLRKPIFFLFNEPVDTQSKLAWNFWKLQTKIVTRHEVFGEIFGTLLYPVELLCVNFAKEGPSTEIMICKKPA